MITARFMLVVLLAGIAGCSNPPPAPPPILPADEALEGFVTDLIGALANIDLAGDASAKEQLRSELLRIVEQYGPSLRPQTGSKRYVSPDHRFVVVIAANAPVAEKGEDASAADDHALLVIAVGGNGGVGQRGKSAGGAGSAKAEAADGLAVALGGRGGDGRERGQGGAGGGAGNASGKVGSIGLGGSGGRGHRGGGHGGTAGGTGITNPTAIVELVRVLNKHEGG
jgi:hypothetical protein